MKTIFSIIFIFTLALLPAFPVQPSLAAPAATIAVTTTVDEFDTGADCSLREAIQSANTDTAFGGCAAGSGADTINLPAGTYTLSGAADEDLNASGDLDIASDLAISGADARTTIIQAGTDETNGVDRVLHTLGDHTIEINAVTIRYGKTLDGVAAAGDSACSGVNGGGIYIGSGSTLILNDSEVIFNRTGAGGDGCTSGIASHGAGGNGGGIFVLGSLELNNTGVRWNMTGAGGNGLTGGYGRDGGEGSGIYIYNTAAVTLTNSTVGYNQTSDGGLGGDGDPAGGNGGNGGRGGSGAGIFSRYASLTLNASFVAENTTGLGGAGGDAVNGDGGNGGYGGTGAGIYIYGNTMLLNVDDSSIQGNITGLGGDGGTGSGSNGTTRDYPGPAGGIYTGAGSTVTLTDTGIQENSGMSGGLFNSGNNTALMLSGCTISGNTSAGYGGGIYNGSGVILSLINSTVSGNLADDNGGGIFNSGTVSLLHATITDNITDQDNDGSGNGGGFYGAGAFTMTHTIVANNLDMGGFHPDCYGTVASGDYNLLGIGDTGSCAFSAQSNDQVGTMAAPLDPQLTALADNGGPTETHAPLPSSPAVDLIPSVSCLLVVDQRGYSRPVDYDGDGTAQCDTGAVEIRENYLLIVGLAGEGEGNVQSLPFGIDCGEGNSDCNEFYDINTVVTLTASAALTATFAGWSGDCTGLDLTCTITMDLTHSVTATFDLVPTYTLNIDLVGEGSGNVISDPAGIDCGTGSEDCAEVFYEGTVITLTAASTVDSSFAGWDGDASGTDNPILITMESNKSIEAHFTENATEQRIYLPLVIR